MRGTRRRPRCRGGRPVPPCPIDRRRASFDETLFSEILFWKKKKNLLRLANPKQKPTTDLGLAWWRDRAFQNATSSRARRPTTPAAKAHGPNYMFFWPILAAGLRNLQLSSIFSPELSGLAALALAPGTHTHHHARSLASGRPDGRTDPKLPSTHNDTTKNEF